MFFDNNVFMTLLLYACLAVFVIGTAYRIYQWCSVAVGAQAFTTRQRFWAALKGVWGVFFSQKHFVLLRSLVLDVILGGRQFQVNFARWFMHTLILWGFVLLLIFHALGSIINPYLVGDYNSTLNPFWFLRDLFGFMVFVGVGIAIIRRLFFQIPRLKTSPMDIYAIGIVFVIITSGLALESTKITSHTVFMDMVENWAGMDVDDEEEDISALEALWVKDFGLVSPNVSAPFDQDMISMGKDANEANCLSCHSPAQWAFFGYAGAKIISPIAGSLDKINAAGILWYIHLISCFLGLAYLPFSKMFHIFATPVSLMANAVMDENSMSENIATKQAIELDACVHCCTCSLTCSAMMAEKTSGNSLVLPSEKIVFLRKLAAGKDLDERELAAISHGVYMCTNCDRCTVVCPSGINLRELWFLARESLIQEKGPQPLILTPLSYYRAFNRKKLASNTYQTPVAAAKKCVAGNFEELMDKSGTVDLSKAEPGSINPDFAYCFGCQTCTTACPVVGEFENPQARLGLLPHQIMCSLGLGLTQMASGASMIWDCLTCYQCQEQCPQNVPVTDILFELKNAAAKRVSPNLKTRE